MLQEEKDKKQTPPILDKGLDNKPTKKSPKFNIYWIYLAIIALIIGANYLPLNPEAAKISEQEVKQNMILKGDVDRLDFVKNKELVRVYIKPDSITKEYYVQKLKIKATPATIKGKALFEFKVTDWKGFQEDLKDFYKQHNIDDKNQVQTFTYDEGEWFGPVANTLVSILVMVGLWVLLMRKMGGPGGAGGPTQ